jgi:hypothetical protein
MKGVKQIGKQGYIENKGRDRSNQRRNKERNKPKRRKKGRKINKGNK